MTDVTHLSAIILLSAIGLGVLANEVIIRLNWHRRIHKLAAKQQQLRIKRIANRKR